MECMTNQQIADRALEADQARRAAWSRGDYQESREKLVERNDWISRLEGKYHDKRIEGIFRGAGKP